MTAAWIMPLWTKQAQVDQALRTLESRYGLRSLNSDGGDEDGSDGLTLSFPPGSLWLALAMTNDPTYGNMAAITLNGTTNDAWYEILSKQSLTDPGWWSEGSLQGFANQAASQASVTADSSATNVFLWVPCPHERLGRHPANLVAVAKLWPHWAGSRLRSRRPRLSLLESYLEGTEPNFIQFSVTATNNYAKASPASVQLELTGGVPSYQAVLVDSTNSAVAIWSPYTSTNLSVDLGSAEGWHDVWVGLRGFSASSLPNLGVEAAQAGLHPAPIVASQPGRRGWSPSRRFSWLVPVPKRWARFGMISRTPPGCCPISKC